VEGSEPGEAKAAHVELHNPTRTDLRLTLTSPLFGADVQETVNIAAGSSEEMAIPLRGWKTKRITIFTSELTDQIKRRTTSFRSGKR